MLRNPASFDPKSGRDHRPLISFALRGVNVALGRMVRPRASHIPRDLRSLFPTRWLNETAREVGLVERRRKVAPAAFFWALVLGFAVGHQRSIAFLRRFYRATTGTALVPTRNVAFLPGTRTDDAKGFGSTRMAQHSPSRRSPK